MSPGFTVLTHAEGFEPGTAEVQEIIASMAKLASDAGCRKVARVTGRNPLGGFQIDRLARLGGTTYSARNFRNEAEASAYLDSEDS